MRPIRYEPFVLPYEFPTHAVFCFASGQNTANSVLYANGNSISHDFLPLSYWPDGSVKWAHIYHNANHFTNYNWSTVGSAAQPTISTQDTGGTIRVNTQNYYFEINKTNKNVLLHKNNVVLWSGDFGAFAKDARGIEWNNKYQSGVINIEHSGNFTTTLRIDNYLYNSSKNTVPFLRAVTYIQFFGTSQLIKFNHGVTFTEPMSDIGITELGFNIPYNVTFWESNNGSGNQNHRVVQYDFDRCVTANVHTFSNDGWFRLNGSGALFVKDFWQKFPKQVGFENNGLQIYSWPRHSQEINTNDVAPERIHQFLFAHNGPVLNLKLPARYYQKFKEKTNVSVEYRPEHAWYADAQGMSMYDEFAIDLNKQEYPERTHLVYLQSPIGFASGNSESKAITEQTPIGNNCHICKPLYDSAVQIWKGYANPNHTNAFGWMNYGDTHHYYTPHNNQADLYRLWVNTHYGGIQPWLLSFVTGRYDILDVARRLTNHQSSIDFIRAESNRGYYSDRNTFVSGYSHGYHASGNFYHCKGILHHGTRGPGMTVSDDHSASLGHWVYSAPLLFGWLIGGNRWHKEGYDLWASRIFSTTFNSFYYEREAINQLTELIWLHKYTNDNRLLHPISGFTHALSNPTATTSLWQPIWEILAMDYFSGVVYPHSTGYITTWNLQSNGPSILGHCLSAKHHSGVMSVAHAVNQTRNTIYNNPLSRYDGYGSGPGPLGDNHYSLLVPWLAGYLEEKNIDNYHNIFPRVGYPGAGARTNYTNQTTGHTIYVLNSGNTEIVFNTVIMPTLGDNDSPRLIVTGPTGQVIFDKSYVIGYKQLFSGIISPTGAGLYKFQFYGGANYLEYPLTNMPEAAVIQESEGSKRATWQESQTARLVTLDNFLYKLAPETTTIHIYPDRNEVLNINGQSILGLSDPYNYSNFVVPEAFSLTVGSGTGWVNTKLSAISSSVSSMRVYHSGSILRDYLFLTSPNSGYIEAIKTVLGY